MSALTFILSLVACLLLSCGCRAMQDGGGTHGLAHRWKISRDINTSITSEQIDVWRNHDTSLHRYLREQIPEALEHTGLTSFDDHLVGVQSILRTWGASLDVCNAGLFHSIYGTEGYQGFKLPLSERSRIRALIGSKAERLVWIFCMVDRASVDATLDPALGGSDCGWTDSGSGSLQTPTFKARAELGAFDIPLASKDEWLAFLELSLADWLEQVEGAAARSNELFQWQKGTAWAYRREAYAKMAEILAGSSARLAVAKQMHAEIYASEPPETRHLVQSVTPPMSAAAFEAREAIRSAML